VVGFAVLLESNALDAGAGVGASVALAGARVAASLALAGVALLTFASFVDCAVGVVASLFNTLRRAATFM
jgi:hypothetical protein